MLNYNGYLGHVTYDDESELFDGKVINTKDIITFQSDNSHQLKQAFVDSIKNYLAFCKERNEQPEKPFSGKFNLRLSAEFHRKVFVAAKQQGVSINTWINDTLSHVVQYSQCTDIKQRKIGYNIVQ